MSGIRISDTATEGGLSFDLIDILQHVKGQEYYWAVLFLEGVTRPGAGFSVPEFEAAIKESRSGLSIEWAELVNLAESYYQVYDSIIIGCRNATYLRRFDEEREMYESCDVVIEMFDSSYCDVHSKDAKLLARLSESFSQVEELNGTTDSSCH